MLGLTARDADVGEPLYLDHARSICCAVTSDRPRSPCAGGVLAALAVARDLGVAPMHACLVGVVARERVQAPRVQCVRLSGEVGHHVTAG